MNQDNMKFSAYTESLYLGERIPGMELAPECLPLFNTTAFNPKTLTEAENIYKNDAFRYVRGKNPNRTALAEVVSYMEGGEDSLICTCGMGAISTTLLHFLKSGDHVVCNADIYGETQEIMADMLPRFGIETTLVSFTDTENIRKAMKSNTKIVYTEVVSNPCIRLTDIPAVAEIAHAGGAMLVVDNTFTSAVNFKPIEMGADISINSMTKFMNGHSDAIGGSITSTKAIIKELHEDCCLLGTPGDPYNAWMILRGLRTVELRVAKQSENAAKLASALEKEPHILAVTHPSLESHPQHELARKLFKGDHMTAMMNFTVPEDRAKIDDFMSRLRFSRYAMTLGGFKSSLSHPVTSSHNGVPDDVRRTMGITPGMFRLSVGIEDAEDLIADFHQALKAFD